MNLNTFVAIDFETANSKYASACQVALARVQNGRIVETWQSLVRPHDLYKDLGPRQAQIHGISPKDYLSAPTLADLWPTIKEFIGESWLAAHQASFDIGVLRQTLESWGIDSETPLAVCSLRMAREAFGQESVRLPLLAKRLDIPLANHHNASDDAVACGLITNLLFEYLQVKEFSELHRRFGYHGPGASAFRGNSLKLEQGRLEVEQQQEEIKKFFQQNVNFVELNDAPLSGLTVGSIRSSFGMSRDELAGWVELLGGQFLDIQLGSPWPDLVIIGNSSDADPSRKSEDLSLLLAAKRSDVEKIGQDDLFALVVNHLVF